MPDSAGPEPRPAPDAAPDRKAVTPAAAPHERVAAAPAAPPRITFGRVISSGLHKLLDLDFATARTVLGLARAPGALCRDYLLGARARYVNPVKFAFLTATLYVLLNELTSEGGVAAVFDPFLAYQWLWPYVALLLLLPAAGLQRLLFRRRALNAAECYTFALFVFGEILLAAALVRLLARGTGLGLPLPVAVALMVLYTAWAATGLYADRRPSVWLRGALVCGFVLASLAGLLYQFQAYRFGALSG